MREELKQKRFNYLVAQKPLFQYRREWVWLCKCDCGKETNVRISKLKNGTTKSCGCFKNKNVFSKSDGTSHKAWKGYEGLSKSFFSRMKDNSLLRGIEFNVTIEYLWKLFKNQKGNCAYTGMKIFLPINQRKLRAEANENIASLDRTDNSKGYIEGNLQWTCKRVNYMKHTMNDEYFLTWIKSIYEFKNLKIMFFDWKAATERHNDGNIFKSIQINKERFKYSDQIADIFTNTAERLNYEKPKTS